MLQMFFRTLFFIFLYSIMGPRVHDEEKKDSPFTYFIIIVTGVLLLLAYR